MTSEKLHAGLNAGMPVQPSEFLEHFPAGMLVCRAVAEKFSLEYVNENFCGMLGYSRVEYLSQVRDVFSLLSAEEAQELRGRLRLLMSGGQEPFSAVFRMQCKSGSWLWVKCQCTAQPLREEAFRLYLACTDVDKEVRRLHVVSENEKRCRQVLDGTQDVVFEWDCQTKILLNTHIASAQYGLKSRLDNFPECAVENGEVHPDDVAAFLDIYARYERGATTSEGEYRIRRLDGGYSWFRVLSSGVFDSSGTLRRVLGLLTNIDRYKMELHAVMDKASRDPLTGLFNREVLGQRVDALLAGGPAVAGLLLLDLDNFKLVNDTYGHSAGDRVLRAISRMLEQLFSGDDVLGRVGGDEFVACIRAKSEAEVRHRAQEAVALLRQAAEESGKGCGVTCSLGVALFPQDGDNYADLFHKADIAMYRAKTQGKNCCCGARGAAVSVPPEKDTGGALMAEGLHDQLAMYREALLQSRIAVWEYDVAGRRMLQTDISQKQHGFDAVVEDVPESLIRCGYVHPDSRESFRRLYERVVAGEPFVCADVRLLTADRKSSWWERIRYSTVYDGSGRPLRALGIGHDVTQEKEAEIRYQQEFQLRLSMSADILRQARVNVTRGCVDFVREYSGRNEEISGMSYESLLERYARDIVHAGDRKRYMALLNRQAVQRAHAAGETCLSMEYRSKGGEGRLLWVRIAANLIEDAGSGDLCMYLHVRDVDERKRAELALRQRAERDTVTGAYKKETALHLVRQGVERARTHKRGMALLLVNVDAFSGIIGSAGFAASEEVLRELGLLLSLKFGAGAVVGRMDGDEFLVFISRPDVPAVRAAAENVRQSMNMPFMFPKIGMPVSVSIGMVFAEREGQDFDTLYLQAGMALDAARVRGRNRCEEYSDAPLAAAEREALPQSLPAGRESVTGGGFEQVLLRCAFAFAASEFAAALKRVLRELGKYYHASAVCLFERDGFVERYESHVWQDAHAELPPLDASIFLSPRLAGWRAAVTRKGHVCMPDVADERAEHPDMAALLEEAGVSSLLCATLRLDGRHLGAIVVVNPVRQQQDTALASAVSYFLANEVRRRHMRRQEHFLEGHDALTGLPNRVSYQKFCENLTEDSLIALGVASVDINGLKQLNNTYGFSYGDNIILLTGQVLQQVFGQESVFRFAGDEFLVVSQNLTHEAFTAKVEEACESIRASGGGIAAGSVWSDTDMRLDEMIKAADKRLVINKQRYYQTLESATKRHNPAWLRRLLGDMQAGCYQMFLQPKTDVASRHTIGAEALVRFFQKDGTMVPPDRFIPAREADGSIIYIDLFIFEQVCRMLAEWQAQGRALMTISLNFSRVTLFHEHLLEKVESLCRQYDVPARYLEIELTEGFGELERETLVRTCAALSALGCRISLDDFGARYSNLSILSVLKLDVLKLDKSLVNDLPANPATRSIVRNALNICRDLGVESVAEGVESNEQLKVLEELGCNVVQGYLFDKPMPRNQFEERHCAAPLC